MRPTADTPSPRHVLRLPIPLQRILRLVLLSLLLRQRREGDQWRVDHRDRQRVDQARFGAGVSSRANTMPTTNDTPWHDQDSSSVQIAPLTIFCLRGSAITDTFRHDVIVHPQYFSWMMNRIFPPSCGITSTSFIVNLRRPSNGTTQFFL